MPGTIIDAWATSLTKLRCCPLGAYILWEERERQPTVNDIQNKQENDKKKKMLEGEKSYGKQKQKNSISSAGGGGKL